MKPSVTSVGKKKVAVGQEYCLPLCHVDGVAQPSVQKKQTSPGVQYWPTGKFLICLLPLLRSVQL